VIAPYNTYDDEQVRSYAAQLLAGLDPQEIIGLLQVAHDLAPAPSPPGTFAFTASTNIAATPSSTTPTSTTHTNHSASPG
jgi:hypothetical protein